jgi:hypothetical protein
MDQNKLPIEPHHQGVASGLSKTISEPMVHLVQTMHLSCVKDEHNLQTDRNELPVEPCHLGGPSGASKMISKPTVRLAQTMHLSCNDTKTVSKRTEMRFQITHVTKEFHRVKQKWFLSLWYVRCKSCTYLASRLALYLNWPKWASSWAQSPKRTIRCIQNDF